MIIKSFSQERFCTWPHFKTEACGVSKMAYWLISRCLFNLTEISILQLFSWRNGEFQELEDLLLPDVARAVVWSKDSLCVGFKREYSLIKVCAIYH